MAKSRHNLVDARLTETQWRDRWEAGRLSLTADGESGALDGNYTITVDPSDGTVSIVLPEHCGSWPRAPRPIPADLQGVLPPQAR
ncbi:MAG: hypothetical protein HOV66_06485 [Streptomycetaceae bacterium]|nr:hypothetical protein [Streptomycetaceae bacterium]